MEDIYAATDQMWSGNPNQALVSYLGEVFGTALDIGCGEGADVAWLAHKGFEVTGIDFAPTAITRARKLIDAHPNATVIHASFTEFALESGLTFDLVSCSYGQLPANEVTMKQLENLVAPGGTLFITHHDVEADSVAMPRWIADHLSADFTVDVLENFERNVKEGAGAHHKLDIVLRALKSE